MRKPLFLFVLTALTIITASAQQIPARSNYLMTPFQDHVASAGNKPCLDMRMGFRSQWAGFEGAPINAFASLSGRLGESERSIHGVGGRIETDEAGPWGTTSFSLGYAYKIQLTSGGRLSTGLSLGVIQHRLSIGRLDFDPAGIGVANDPAVIDATQFLFPTIDAGIWYEDKRSYLGLTMINATAAELFEMTLGTKTHRHVVATIGTSIELDSRFVFRPSANLRVASGLSPSLDVTCSVAYNNLLSLGVGYRNQTALIAHLQLAILEYVTVGYSYDFGISDIRIAAASSHEITLALSACDKGTKRAEHCAAYD
jgi:type IX secretion system PorP/SprF family membrane protein